MYQNYVLWNLECHVHITIPCSNGYNVHIPYLNNIICSQRIKMISWYVDIKLTKIRLTSDYFISNISIVCYNIEIESIAVRYKKLIYFFTFGASKMYERMMTTTQTMPMHDENLTNHLTITTRYSNLTDIAHKNWLPHRFVTLKRFTQRNLCTRIQSLKGTISVFKIGVEIGHTSLHI